MSKLKLKIITDQLTIYRLAADSPIPDQIHKSAFYSISRSEDELSIVCDSSILIDSESASSNWCGYKVLGPLDFSLVGILAKLSTTLAEAGISIFAVSTFDTDYILIKADKMEQSGKVLEGAGYTII